MVFFFVTCSHPKLLFIAMQVTRIPFLAWLLAQMDSSLLQEAFMDLFKTGIHHQGISNAPLKALGEASR